MTETLTKNDTTSSFFYEIKEISNEHEKKKQEHSKDAEEKGCDFNIFDIIGISTKEDALYPKEYVSITRLYRNEFVGLSS